MIYALFTDETNQQPAQHAQFFIYGGMFLPVERLPDLHTLVEGARRDNGFRPADELKFEIHSRPPHVSEAQHRAAKRSILEGCANLDVRFIAYLTLHRIAATRTHTEVIGWGLNSVLGAFNRFLADGNDYGVCIVDRLPFDQGYNFLKEKFQIGMTFPGGVTRRLDRIHLFAASTLGAGHALSVIDIVLGAFRYCVNERRPGREVPRALFPTILSMMWHRTEGGNRVFREYGLLMRPQVVRNPSHAREYLALRRHLAGLLPRSVR